MDRGVDELEIPMVNYTWNFAIRASPVGLKNLGDDIRAAISRIFARPRSRFAMVVFKPTVRGDRK